MTIEIPTGGLPIGTGGDDLADVVAIDFDSTGVLGAAPGGRGRLRWDGTKLLVNETPLVSGSGTLAATLALGSTTGNNPVTFSDQANARLRFTRGNDLIINAAAIATADRTLTLPDPGADDSFAYLNLLQLFDSQEFFGIQVQQSGVGGNAFSDSDYAALIIGQGGSGGEGGLVGCGRFIGTNQPYVSQSPWDYGGAGYTEDDEDNGRVVYYGGGGWDAPDAHQHLFYTVSGAYNETKDSSSLQLALTSSGYLRMNGSISTTIPTLQFLNDNDTGWGRAGANQQHWITGGAVRMHLRDNGLAITGDGADTSLPADTVLALNSTTRAFAPPRMTTTQRDAIGTPLAGHIVYNTTTNTVQFYNGSAWGDI